MSAAFLYLIVAGDGDTPVKIGVAADPGARLRQLQTGNASKLRIAATFEAEDRWIALEWEQLAHKLFGGNRLIGEWFDATAQSVIEHIEHWKCDPVKRGKKAARTTSSLTASEPFTPNHPYVPEYLARTPMREMTEEQRLDFWACFDLPSPPFGFDDWYLVGTAESGVLAAFPVVGFVHGEKSL